MQKHLFIFIFCWAGTGAFAQRGDDRGKICYQGNVVLVKKDYKRFKNDSCDLKKYPDSQKTKELVCKSGYYRAMRDYCTSLELLKHAYVRATSKKLKFRIIQLTAENYTLAGDTMGASIYREKANYIRRQNHDINQ